MAERRASGRRCFESDALDFFGGFCSRRVQPVEPTHALSCNPQTRQPTMAPAPPPPPAQQTRSSARLRSSVAPSQPPSTRPSSSTAVRQTASSQAKQAAAIKDRLEREATRASVAGRTTGASGGNSPIARGTVGRGTFGSARIGTTTASAAGARVRVSVVPPSSTAPPKSTLVAKKREMVRLSSFSFLQLSD